MPVKSEPKRVVIAIPKPVLTSEVGRIPEILHEEDLHGPGLHARGAAFPGTDIYVELGHGTHYAWSATSAGSDLIDQRLELICDPGTPTTYTPGPANGQFYWYDGSCSRQMYERTDTEQALTSGAAPYPPQLITFHIERTIHGPVVGRGTAQHRRSTVTLDLVVIIEGGEQPLVEGHLYSLHGDNLW